MALDVSSTVVGGTALNHFSFSVSLISDRRKTAERQLIFFNKLQHTDSPILRTLFHLPTVKYEILGPGLTAKYGLNGVQGNLSAMNDCVWNDLCRKFDFKYLVYFIICVIFYHLCMFLVFSLLVY